MSEQLIELETKVAFLEKSIAELSDALFGQHQQIERLEKDSERMRGQLKALAGGEGIDPEIARPPHY